MELVVISRGRAGRVRTTEFIPEQYRARTSILCPDEEVEYYVANNPGWRVVPEGGTLNYSQKFHNIVNGKYPEFGRKILILDDDLRFSMRSHDNTSLPKATTEAMLSGLEMLEEMLDVYPLAGLHPRAMGNNAPRGVKECTRINALQAVNLDLIGEIKLDHWPILADMVLNLSLLTSGKKTAIWCELFWDQTGGSNAPGGCSIHRTWEQQRDAVLGLAEMFPKYVTVSQKAPKSGWWGQDNPRYDFIVQWRKAYAGS